jgi:glycosyltransferase involved in cell wall biosynthesis
MTMLYRALCERGHEVLLVSFKRQYPRWLFPGRSDKDPSKKPLKVEAKYFLDPLNPLTWWQTARFIQKEAPDGLVMQWWVPYWAPTFASIALWVRRFTSSKVLFICHNVLPHERGSFDKLLAKLALRQGHFFIVHSEKDFKELRTLLPNAIIQKTVLPIYDAFVSWKIAEDEAKRTLGIDGNALLFFGLVREYKGLKYLLSAMPKVIERIKAHLLIVGEFWEDKKPYLEMIKELGISSYVSIVDKYVPNEELGLYFSAADVVVLPYVDSTQSAVIQLAYGFEKPVITTDVGGLAEVVKDGETGLIVPSRDSMALAEAIVRYFERGLTSLFTANIRAKKESFSWDKLRRLIEGICRG